MTKNAEEAHGYDKEAHESSLVLAGHLHRPLSIH
jgi:hypothetical protein